MRVLVLVLSITLGSGCGPRRRASAAATGSAMTLGSVIAELLALADDGTPSALRIKQAFASRDTHKDVPARWQHDIFLTLVGDVESMAISEDMRGWGTRVELVVSRGTLVDLERVVGPTKYQRRDFDDFHSGEKRRAKVKRGDKSIFISAELDRDDETQVRVVEVSFER